MKLAIWVIFCIGGGGYLGGVIGVIIGAVIALVGGLGALWLSAPEPKKAKRQPPIHYGNAAQMKIPGIGSGERIEAGHFLDVTTGKEYQHRVVSIKTGKVKRFVVIE